MNIAFLGTGLMGAPMARHLARHNNVTVWNRSKEKAQALADVVTVADTAAQAATGADIVISMLIDGPVTRDVMLGQGVLDSLSAGAIVIDMGSVDPQTDKELGEAARARGVRYLDAPVSGGVVGAENASLSIFVGGAVEDFESASEVLERLGRPSHMGALGSGQIAKLANQLIVATTIGAVAEAFHLANAAGCDIAKLQKALQGGFADSRILELHGARMVTGTFEPGGRSVAQLKDLRNAMDAATGAGVDLPLGTTVTNAFRDFVENHEGGELDHSAYYLWLSRRSG